MAIVDGRRNGDWGSTGPATGKEAGSAGSVAQC